MIAGTALVLLCAVVFVAVLNINSLIRRNKDYLLDQAQQALKRKISVGDVEVAFLNGIGVRFKNFTMSDDPAYSTGDFVRAKDLQINLKLWPLLRKQVEVKRVILNEPSIVILRNAKGEFNFSTIGKKEKEKKEQAEEKERGPKEAGPGFLISLVDISNGEIRYRDRKEGTDLDLQKVDLTLEEADPRKPFSVQLGAALFAPQQNIHLKTTIGPLLPNGNFAEVPLAGEIKIDPLDLGKLRNAVPQMSAALPKELDFSGIFKIKELKFKGTLQQLALQSELDGTGGLVGVGKNFHKPAGIPLMVSTDAQYSADTLLLRRLDIKLHTAEIAVKGEVGLGERAELNLSVASKPASLEGWEKIIPAVANYQLSGKTDVRATVRGKLGQGAPMQIQGVVSLAGASARPPKFPKAIRDLNATINFTGQRAEIKETTLSLGNSRIRLAAVVEKFAPLALSYKISTPEVWPADFQAALPDERKADVIKNLSSEGRLAMLESGVTAQAKLLSTEGTLYKVAYKNLDATLSVANKMANIRHLRVNALSGTLQADGEYAFNNPIPRFSLATKVQGIDVKQLYVALSPKAEHDFRGRLNADMTISGSGEKWEEMQPTLRGQGEAEVLQGALLNFNIAEGVLSGITGIPGLTNVISPRLRSKYPATFQAKDTEFKEMKATFDLADRRINVKNLRLAAADYSTQGNGWVDFDRQLDFRSVLLFSQPLSMDIAQSAREVKYMLNNQGQLEMPFEVKGRLPNVKARPDASYIGKMVQRGLLGRGAEELEKRFFGNKESRSTEEPPAADTKKRKKSSTEDLIRKGLEGLFGR